MRDVKTKSKDKAVKTKKNYILKDIVSQRIFRKKPKKDEREENYAVNEVEEAAQASASSAGIELRRAVKHKASNPKTKEEYISTSTNIGAVKDKNSYLKAAPTKFKPQQTEKTIADAKPKADSGVISEKLTVADAKTVSAKKAAAKTKENCLNNRRINSVSALKGTMPDIPFYSESKGAVYTKQQKDPTLSAEKSDNYVHEQMRRQAHMSAKNRAVNHAAQETAKTAKAAAKNTKKAAKKAVEVAATAVKALVSAIAALGGGAAVLVVMLVIAVIAAVAASPLGILISEEADEGIPLSEIREECEAELKDKIEEIKDSIAYDELEISGEAADWDEVLAVFAVKTNMAEDVVVFDEAKKDRLKDVFWDMNIIEYETETVSAEDSTETVLYIEIKSKSADDMAEKYGFTANQKEMLEMLLKNSNDFNV